MEITIVVVITVVVIVIVIITIILAMVIITVFKLTRTTHEIRPWKILAGVVGQPSEELYVHPAAVSCDMVLHQAPRARQCTKDVSLDMSLNMKCNTSPPQGVRGIKCARQARR